VRLFFAIWPPAKTAHALNRWANAVMHEVGGTLTPTANIHLTLAFLGDADPALAQNAAKAVSAARHALHIDDGQYWSHNKIVWVGPKSADLGQRFDVRAGRAVSAVLAPRARAHTPVYLVSTLVNRYRSYLLKQETQVLLITERPWGQPMSKDWITPELIPSDLSAAKPDPDFAGFYLPSLVIANEGAAKAIAFPQLELVPLLLGSQTRWLLNSRITLRRFRSQSADVTQVPSGAILLMNKADFYSDDLPGESCCFWFHDGNFPRFLMCNEGFRSRVQDANLSGLSFRLLGHAF
jgi:hypothetical protein